MMLEAIIEVFNLRGFLTIALIFVPSSGSSRCAKTRSCSGPGGATMSSTIL
jgi:hypothetical protein